MKNDIHSELLVSQGTFTPEECEVLRMPFTKSKAVYINHANFLINGRYYFDYNGLQMKANSTRAIDLKELKNTPVRVYTEKYRIFGIIGGHGLSNSPYIYVFWNQGIPHKTPYPNALFNVNFLVAIYNKVTNTMNL